MGVNFLLEKDDPAYKDYHEYADEVRERMQRAFDLVHERLQQKFEIAKKRYDKRIKEARFSVGNFVWFYSPRNLPGKSRKWRLKTSGPFLIVSKLNNAVYKIQKNPTSKPFIVNIDRITKYESELTEKLKVWQQKVLNEKQEKAISGSADNTNIVNAKVNSGNNSSKELNSKEASENLSKKDLRASDPIYDRKASRSSAEPHPDEHQVNNGKTKELGRIKIADSKANFKARPPSAKNLTNIFIGLRDSPVSARKAPAQIGEVSEKLTAASRPGSEKSVNSSGLEIGGRPRRQVRPNPRYI